MSNETGLDRAVAYGEKLEAFRVTFQQQDAGAKHGDLIEVEQGRKFDRVFVRTKAGQKIGRYFVDRLSWQIFGTKSWAQVNPRRVYGTLDTVADWDWSPYYATPKPGTDAEKQHQSREMEITKNYKTRGRPRKNP
jgi:hypothetical protein